jgi:hypothetical protein
MRTRAALAGIATALIVAGCGAGGALVPRPTSVEQGSAATTTTAGPAQTTVEGSELAAPTTTTTSSTTSLNESQQRLDARLSLAQIPDWFIDEDAAPAGLIAAVTAKLGAGYIGSMQIDWNDSGLGCAGPDQMTLQVITPGYVIFLDRDGSLLRVDASSTGNWVECDPLRALDGTSLAQS